PWSGCGISKEGVVAPTMIPKEVVANNLAPTAPDIEAQGRARAPSRGIRYHHRDGDETEKSWRSMFGANGAKSEGVGSRQGAKSISSARRSRRDSGRCPRHVTRVR